MSWENAEELPTVDPSILQAAYERCSGSFADWTAGRDMVSGRDFLQRLKTNAPEMDEIDTLNLFMRLCLLVQLIGQIDIEWTQSGLLYDRPGTLPFALFHLASTEPAIEQTNDQYTSVQFERDVIAEAIAFFRPN